MFCLDYILLSKASISLKEWHHVAVTFDSSSLKIYVNGLLDTFYDIEGTLLDYSSTTFIGNSDDQVNNDLYVGLMSGLQIWEVALDSTEIHDLYNTTNPVKPELMVAFYTWQSNTFYTNNINNATCLVSSTLSRTVKLDTILQAECSSDGLFENISSIVGISTTVNVQIEPEVPVPLIMDEGLLDMTTIYENEGFLPVRVLVANDSLYATAVTSGLWKFNVEYDEKLNEMILDDPVLVVSDSLCEDSEEVTLANYPSLCFDVRNSKSSKMTPIHVMTSIEQKEALRVYGRVKKPIMPFDIAALSDGIILITDVGAHGIWQYNPNSGQLGTYAGLDGSGLLNGNAAVAKFSSPTGIVVTKEDVIFVADTWNNQIRKIQNGIVSTLAGDYLGRPGYTDGLEGNQVMFHRPFGLSLSEDGTTLLVADTQNHVIRQVLVSNGSTSTLSGAIRSGFADGIGPLAEFGSPVDLAPVPWFPNSTFVTDIENFALRKINRKWSSVKTPVQMIDPSSTFYSAEMDTGGFKGCTFDAKLECIERIEVMPSYGIHSYENLLILADTTGGALKILRPNGETFGSRLDECQKEQERKDHLKVIIAACVSTLLLSIIIVATSVAGYTVYKRKKKKLEEKKLNLTQYVHEEIFHKYELEHSSSPLDQALDFLTQISEKGKIPSAKEAEKIRKVLVCGSLMNGDVSKPLDLHQGLNKLKNTDEGGKIFAQIASPLSTYRRNRSRKRWHTTFAAYQAAHLLRSGSTKPSTELSKSSIRDLHRRESFQAIFTVCDKFRINLFELNEKSKGRPLSVFATLLLQEYGLCDSLSLNEESFTKFVRKVEDLMKDVPYHNKMHVTGVLQAMDFFLVDGGLMSFIVDDYELLACLLAATIHDYQHPGVTSEFLIRTGHDIAITYNDKSPLENFHVSSSYKLMKENPELQFMHDLTDDDQKHIRAMVIDLVMATDMQKHFDILNKGKLLLASKESKAYFQTAHEEFLAQKSDNPIGLSDRRARYFLTDNSDKGLHYLGDSERALVLRIAMKCADLNHAYQTFENHEALSKRVIEEFCQQGDKEQLEGFTPQGLFDRKAMNPVAIAKSQLAFMDVIVIPLFELLSQLLPATSPMLDQIRTNRKMWLETYLTPTSTADAGLTSYSNITPTGSKSFRSEHSINNYEE